MSIISNKSNSGLNVRHPIAADDLEGRCVELAEELIGSLLLNQTEDGVVGGIIVETEAYLGAEDPACHLSHGRTARTEPFFDGAGTIYVFKIYRHSNLNVITEHELHPECILIRAIEPTHGINLMRRRRNKSELTELTTGPGKLTEALGIKKSVHNQTPLDSSTINLFRTDLEDFDVKKSSRVGISSAKEWPLRYTMEKSDFISQNIKKEMIEEFEVESYYEDLSPIMPQSLPESLSNNE